MPEFNRILITGSAGSLGAHLRSGLPHLANQLRLVDRQAMGAAGPNEEIVSGNLSDAAFAREVTKDCDASVHFAGIPREQSFQELITDTIPASYNIYESARLNSVKRVVYASSIHAVGFYPVEDIPDTSVMHRPDTLYGLGKCFVEDLSRLYWDKFGIESVCLRICSCFAEPADRRMLWSWLSFADCVRLVESALVAQRVGHSIIYGTSANAERGVSNSRATHIGFAPHDSADGHRARVLGEKPRADPQQTATRFVGGGFASYVHPDDAKK